jgi:secreted trypsin-like serine protease
MQADLPIAENAACEQEFSTDLTDNMLCAGFPQGERSGCHGDSGGPLVVPDGIGGWRQAGIVSWGEGYYCGTFTVFTRVANFAEWVHSYTHPAGALVPILTRLLFD